MVYIVMFSRVIYFCTLIDDLVNELETTVYLELALQTLSRDIDEG